MKKVYLLVVVLFLGIFIAKMISTSVISEVNKENNNSDVTNIDKYLGNDTDCTIEEYRQFNNDLDRYYKGVSVHGYVAEIKDEHNITVGDEKGDYVINVYTTKSIESLDVGQEVFVQGDMSCTKDEDQNYCYGLELYDSTSKNLSARDENAEYIDVNAFYEKCELLYKNTSFSISAYLIKENIYGGSTYYLVEENNHNDKVNRIRVMFTDDSDIDQYVDTKVQIEASYWDPVDSIALSNAKVCR